MRFREYFEKLPDETKIFKKSPIPKVLRTFILHIHNPKKKHYEFSVKNWFNTKVGNVTFFSQNWFIGLSEYIWIFSAFFLILKNPVYREILQSHLRIVLIDYP